MVLVTSLDPLIAYVHDGGFVKVAPRKYKAPDEKNFKDVHIHLTNIAINYGHRSNGVTDEGREAFIPIEDLYELLDSGSTRLNLDADAFKVEAGQSVS